MHIIKIKQRTRASNTPPIDIPTMMTKGVVVGDEVTVPVSGTVIVTT